MNMKKNTKKSISNKNSEEKSGASFGLQPLGDRVIVKEIDVKDSETTDSGIYIPQNAALEKGAKRGTVVAVGPGKFDDGALVPMNVSVGDSVIFQWGDTVNYNGEEYYILREQEIAAIIRS